MVAGSWIGVVFKEQGYGELWASLPEGTSPATVLFFGDLFV